MHILLWTTILQTSGDKNKDVNMGSLLYDSTQSRSPVGKARAPHSLLRNFWMFVQRCQQLMSKIQFRVESSIRRACLRISFSSKYQTDIH